MMFPLAGNGGIKTTILNSISASRIPHAMIIEGEYGTGKHTLSEYLAMSLVCENEDKPCGNCKNCHLISVGSHPDIVLVSPDDGKKNITVDKIRELRAKAFIKPHMSPSRVFIIEKAETMNEQSQNALLKVLEEPPGNTVFIMLTQNKSAFLDTIISRCVIFSLFCPNESEAFLYLSSLKYDSSEIKKALSATKNNIGKTLDILNNKSTDIIKKAVNDFTGAITDGGDYELLKILSRFEKDRLAADAFFEELRYTASQKALTLKNYQDRKAMVRIYEEIPAFQSSLKTNVNLALLFSAAVCKIKSTANQK